MDETYFQTMKAQFWTVESPGFDRGKLNQAMLTHGSVTMDDFTESNYFGRFRRQAKGIDIYGNLKQNIWGYFVTTPGGY
jgi:hypothetical protein